LSHKQFLEELEKISVENNNFETKISNLYSNHRGIHRTNLSAKTLCDEIGKIKVKYVEYVNYLNHTTRQLLDQIYDLANDEMTDDNRFKYDALRTVFEDRLEKVGLFD